MYEYERSGKLQRLVRRMAATRPAAWICARVQHRVDRLVYALTRGRTTISSWTSGLPIVMLTTIGARTGRKHTVPLLALRDGADVVVIASNYGRPRHPSWYHNRKAHPRAWIAIEGLAHEFEAREIAGIERERYFQEAVEMYPGFLKYRRWAAERRIRVVRLSKSS
jgi:deazaflavin-dependent oxidoreductase (nitroreductase family)